jgi:hypothetical protein
LGSACQFDASLHRFCLGAGNIGHRKVNQCHRIAPASQLNRIATRPAAHIQDCRRRWGQKLIQGSQRHSKLVALVGQSRTVGARLWTHWPHKPVTPET